MIPTNDTIVQFATSERRISASGRPTRRWKSSIRDVDLIVLLLAIVKNNDTNKGVKKHRVFDSILRWIYRRYAWAVLLNSHQPIHYQHGSPYFCRIVHCYVSNKLTAEAGSLRYEGCAFSEDKLDLKQKHIRPSQVPFSRTIRWPTLV